MSGIFFDFFEERCGAFPEFKPDDFVCHKAILGAGIIIIEGMVNLEKLPKRFKNFFACPLKIMVTEGSPARIFAAIED